MTNPLAIFQKLLRELFQFDCADLDFGIYRIVNRKREVIERFITNDLPKAVPEQLDSGALAEQAQTEQELQEVHHRIGETLGDAAIDADGNLEEMYHSTPLGKEYLELKAKSAGGQGRDALETAIFNHLYAFFSRYYQDGDFISKRRYSKHQRYAIPYNGEEVHLHWANSDQYYIKTGEHFRDYSFTVRDITVHFKLQVADIEQDNIEGDKRFFLPCTEAPTWDAEAKRLDIWDKKNPMLGRKGIATQHEYVLWRTWSESSVYLRPANVRMMLDKAESLILKYGGVNEQVRRMYGDWVKRRGDLTGGERAYRLIDDNGRVYRSVAMTWPNPKKPPDKFFIPLIHPVTEKPCPVPNRGWSRTPEKMQELLDRDEIIFGKDETVQPTLKVFLYVNGDSFIREAKALEPVFKRRMFAETQA